MGLYLAALSLRGEPDLPAAVKRLRGDDHLIAEYFRDELLSRLSSDYWRFLTRVSVLEDLSGPLCDAVLEQTAGEKMLVELSRSNVMLAPVDRGHQRFRLHPLFRAALTIGAAPGRAASSSRSCTDGPALARAPRRPRRGDRPRRRRPATSAAPVSCCAQISPGCSRRGRNAEVRAWLAASAPTRSRPAPRSRSRRRTAV